MRNKLITLIGNTNNNLLKHIDKIVESVNSVSDGLQITTITIEEDKQIDSDITKAYTIKALDDSDRFGAIYITINSETDVSIFEYYHSDYKDNKPF